MAHLLLELHVLSNGSEVVQKGVCLTRSGNEEHLGAEVSRDIQTMRDVSTSEF